VAPSEFVAEARGRCPSCHTRVSFAQAVSEQRTARFLCRGCDRALAVDYSGLYALLLVLLPVWWMLSNWTDLKPGLLWLSIAALALGFLVASWLFKMVYLVRRPAARL